MIRDVLKKSLLSTDLGVAVAEVVDSIRYEFERGNIVDKALLGITLSCVPAAVLIQRGSLKQDYVRRPLQYEARVEGYRTQ